MKRIFLFLAVLLCGAAMSSCTNEASVSLAEASRPVKLVFEVCPFGAEDEDGIGTKTHVTPVNNYSSYAFSWSVNDTVGIFPSGGSQIYFKVESDGSASSASFDGGAWMPKEGYTFRSYFPFIGNYYLNPAHIPVSFAGEEQTGNANSDHFQQFDYMYTPATEYDHDKNTFTFAFRHLITGVLPWVELPAGHYTGLDLSLDTPLFVTEGEYDLTSSTPEIVGKQFTKDFHVDLDITFSQTETLIAYVPLAPLDMSGKNLTITITEETGKQYAYTYVPGKAYAASNIYRLRSPVSFTIGSVSVDPTELELAVEETQQLTATVLPENAANKSVTWTSSNPSVASVSTTGLVTALTPGTTTITVTTEEGGKTATCAVTVKTVDVTSVTLDNTELSLTKGGNATLTATVNPSNATDKTVTWTSSNPDVATVNSSGKVTAVGGGTATITATAGSKSATCEVTVTVPVTGVSLNKTSTSLNIGGTETLTATISPSDATNKNVTWTSNATSVATVNSSGEITAVAVGTATITVKTADGNKTATCTVTVNPIAVTSVTLNKSELSLTKGSNETLTATVKPDNATDKTVSWSSSSTSVATVDANGKVTAVGGGSTTITATAGGKSATCAVTVTVPVTGVSLNKTSTSLNIGGTETLTATISPSDATNKNVTWTSNATSVATVNSSGKITAVAVGTATITVKTADGNKTATCTVTVNPIAVTGISLDKTSLSFSSLNVTQQLTATVTPANATDKTVSWSSSNSSVATVSSSGLVTSKGSGSATITATAGLKSATCAVTVNIPVTSVTLNKTSTSLNVGQTETLTATVLPSNATNRTVTWRSSNTTVATVSNGKITAKAGGSTIITATAGGKSATCDVTVTVPVTGVNLNKTSLSLKKGSSETLVATVLPSGASETGVTWSSSSSTIASVDANGKVTAKKIGSATITVKTVDGNKTATCSVNVTAPDMTGFTLNPSSLDLFEGDVVTVTATPTPSDARLDSYYWYIDYEIPASVVGNGWTGEVHAYNAGTTDLKVVINGIEKHCTITVHSPEPAAVDLGTGLSVYWGDRNLHALSVSDFGEFYYWTDIKDYSRNGWRLPTKDEMNELISKCDITKATVNGVSGFRCTPKGGSSSVSIFLPDAGGYNTDFGSSHLTNMGGGYWSKTASYDPSYCSGWRFSWSNWANDETFVLVEQGNDSPTAKYRYTVRLVKSK